MAQQKRDVERLIEDGLIRYGGGDLAGALAAWERALIQEPGNLQAIGYIDYVRQVFEQLNRPTRDELVVPFGLGHGDAPDYQIEIAPEPPDDEAVERGGGLQDGWPISSDDERDTVDRLYSSAEPPGTLDLELDDASELLEPDLPMEPALPMELDEAEYELDDEPGEAAGDSADPAGRKLELEVTSALDDLTPARGPAAAAPLGADTTESDGFEGPEQELTPGFLEAGSAAPDEGERASRDSTPGFGDASGNSTDLKRPDLGFVKARQAHIVRRPEGGAEPPSSGVPQPMTEESRAARDSRDGREGRGGRDRDARDSASLDAPTQPLPSKRALGPQARPSKPGLEVPAERPSRSALAAPVGSRGSIPLPPPIERDQHAASDREPTRPRQAVSALLAMANAGNAGAVPRLPAMPPGAEPGSSDGRAERRSGDRADGRSDTRPGSRGPSRPAPGLLDPWSELAEGNPAGGDDYANLELAPLIEELPPSSESGEPELPSPTARPEAMTRDLGLAGRYKPREDLKFGEESPTRELMRPGTEDEEKTQAWATAPGAPPITDALDILAAQISPRLERDVPPGETKEDRLRRRISTLVEVANEYSRLGDLRRAVAAADLALGEDPDSALAQKLIHRNRDAIQTIFQGFLGSLERRPALARSLFALGSAQIGARAAFLLSRVDGNLTYDEILDVSGMPRLEAYRYLCQLHIRGILNVE